MPNVVPPGTSVNFPSPNGDVGLALPPLGSMGNLGTTTSRTSCFASVDPEADASRRKAYARPYMKAFNLFNWSMCAR